MRIVLGSDHYGLPLKRILVEHLHGAGYTIEDVGTMSEEPVDYPDIAEKLSLAVAQGKHDRGILICGTGIGMALVANKVPGIRAAQIHDIYTAERAAKSNDANVVTLGAQVIGPETAKMLVDAWIRSDFVGGRSAPKVEKIKKIDQRYRSELSSED
jgi:ribose 5-phosphate isomerase B